MMFQELIKFKFLCTKTNKFPSFCSQYNSILINPYFILMFLYIMTLIFAF